jgi:trigger factor
VVTLKVRGRANGEEVLSDDNLPYEVGSKYLGGLITNDLDEPLEGKNVGDQVEGNAFAPPYAANHPLAGAEIEVTAEIVEHKRPDLPEVDDEFAKGFDFDSKTELLEAVSRDVGASKERERDRLIENLALSQLVEQAEFELPDEMIEREVDEMAARAAYEMQQQDKSEEEIAQRMAEVKSQRAEESTRELKAFFLLDKIVEKERLLVTETEVKEAVAMIGAQSGKTPEQMYELLRDSGRLSSLRNQLREKKARERLRKKVKVSEATAEDAGKKPAKKKTAKKKAAAKKKKEE